MAKRRPREPAPPASPQGYDPASIRPTMRITLDWPYGYRTRPRVLSVEPCCGDMGDSLTGMHQSLYLQSYSPGRRDYSQPRTLNRGREGRRAGYCAFCGAPIHILTTDGRRLQ